MAKNPGPVPDILESPISALGRLGQSRPIRPVLSVLEQSTGGPHRTPLTTQQLQRRYRQGDR